MTDLGAVTDWSGAVIGLEAVTGLYPSSCCCCHLFDAVELCTSGGAVTALRVTFVTPMHKEMISKPYPSIPDQSAHPLGSSLTSLLGITQLDR